MSFFFYFIEKVFSWNEIIIPMLSVSFESSLIWYSERGQTSIFITHSKCHFHAAISFTSYFSNQKKTPRIKPRSTWKDVARVFGAVHDDIFKNNREFCMVSKESWGVPGYTGTMSPLLLWPQRVNLCLKAHTGQFLLFLTLTPMVVKVAFLLHKLKVLPDHRAGNLTGWFPVCMRCHRTAASNDLAC